MASILPNFEYDIFISYRHNDNLDGWVTDFVQSLEKELKGTLKEIDKLESSLLMGIKSKSRSY